jgi:ABC-type glycerol-3-phosphate transport system substrate-binding protein
MKTFQIVVLAIFGVGALVGLVVFATGKGTGGGSSQIGTVVIWGLVPEDAVNTALAEMSVTDKRLSAVSYVEKTRASFGNELAQAIAESAGPDLIIISQEELLQERAKLTLIPFESLPERTFIDSYVPIADLLLTETGSYGIPLVADPLVMYYNKTTLIDAGVATPPTTWEGVNGLAQTLSQVTPAGAVLKSVVPLGDYVNVQNARALLSTIFLQAGVPITVQNAGRTEALLQGNDDKMSESAESALNFFTQFSDPAKTVYTWNRTLPNSRTAFLAGDLALYPGFASERPYLAGANPNLSFDMAPIPQPAVMENRTTYGLLYFAAVPRSALNPNGAFEVAFALSAPGPVSLIAESASMAPALRGLLSPDAGDKYASVFYPEALRARGWLSPSASATDGIFAGMIGNVTSGRRSAQESLQSADDSLQAALK